MLSRGVHTAQHQTVLHQLLQVVEVLHTSVSEMSRHTGDGGTYQQLWLIILTLERDITSMYTGRHYTSKYYNHT